MIQISILRTINEITDTEESLCARVCDNAQENIKTSKTKKSPL